eukprot:gene5882-6804_t
MDYLPNEILERIISSVFGNALQLETMQLFRSVATVSSLWRRIALSLLETVSLVRCYSDRASVYSLLGDVTRLLFNRAELVPRLSSVRLSVGIDCDTLAVVARPLSKHMSLTAIDLSNNYLGALAIKSLKTLLVSNQGAKLKLNLAGNVIGFRGTQRLSRYLALPQNRLVSLDVSNNNMADSGAKTLVMSLINNQVLESLNMSGNNIGRDSVRFIVEMFKYNRTLRHLLTCARRSPVSLNLAFNKILETGLCRINSLLMSRLNNSTSDQSSIALDALDLTGNDSVATTIHLQW